MTTSFLNWTEKVTPKEVFTVLLGILAIILIIPPLRKFVTALLTSKEFAIKYVTGKIQALVMGVIFVSGIIRLLTVLLPWLVQNAPQWIQDIVKDDLKLIIVAVLGFIIWNYLEYAYRALVMRWTETLQPTPVASAPYFGTQVVVQQRPDNSYFMPSVDGKVLGLDVRFVVAHALSFYGMGFVSYLYNNITIGMIEYPRNIFNRIFRHYGGLQPQCNLYTSPENFYLGMMNTSMACWMNSKTGNLDFYNLRLTFNETDTIIIDHVEIFLDHDKKIFVKMEIDGKEVTDPEQPSIMAQCIFAIYTHPQVHWWANGARQLNGLWKSAQESGDVTQWMNMASTYISWIFIGNTAATMAGIISHNMNNGLPFHFSELEQRVSANSTAHQIGKVIRAQMKIQYPSWTDAQVNVLMASTLYHSSDHYYTTYYMSWASQSKYLMQDNSLLRIALFAPNKYYTRKLLCAQRLDDPICKLIYDAAVQFDPAFAKTALFIACAN